MKYIYHFIIVFFPTISFSQLILGGNDPQDLVTHALSGSGVSISNIQYTGSPDAIAYFSSSNITDMPYSSGFLMTTGSKYYAQGPNNSTNAGIDNQTPGFALFNSVFNATSYNASVIEFDLVPSGNTLHINYIFGSEEYSGPTITPVYAFNDAFGIFISGPGITGTQNMARLPNTSPVSTRTLNPSANSQYFVYNGSGSEGPYNSSDQYLQYNGLSIPLTASSSNLTPGSSYHIIMVVADAGNAMHDSGVFLEEGGVTASIDETTLDHFVSILYNSSKQEATIQISEYEDHLTYSIVDLSGKIWEQSKISETTLIDLSDYSSGMYLIRVEGNNGQITKKVIR
ncbi:choice-of-anchor L domain-containing protein [Fluviicola chungangensis]|uniref:T9SS type A sorting domain-containing protein n=1 Tax=Fluviicola chungangensis TaxID=2597671 RepID=A0A556MPV8_9FLAO|nr:choice-of-anchor L domain-containing protein [Fluviicola chungangensis]TSJ41946.1 T9SS type A sorting domain-containing protein [Fluviicola chungangensis]